MYTTFPGDLIVEAHIDHSTHPLVSEHNLASVNAVNELIHNILIRAPRVKNQSNVRFTRSLIGTISHVKFQLL